MTSYNLSFDMRGGGGIIEELLSFTACLCATFKDDVNTS